MRVSKHNSEGSNLSECWPCHWVANLDLKYDCLLQSIAPPPPPECKRNRMCVPIFSGNFIFEGLSRENFPEKSRGKGVFLVKKKGKKEEIVTNYYCL